MSAGKPRGLTGVATFLRKNKYALLICLFSLILLLALRMGNSPSEKERDSSDFSSYAAFLREELETSLSLVSGVGTCRVLITFSDCGETVYATDEDVSSSGNGEKFSEDKKYVLISSRSDGLVLKVYSPSVLGVAVICQGGDNVRVKNDVTEILSRTLGIPADRISVKKSNFKE